MNGRIYDPLIGRFLSADLLVQNPGNLQSYNRYSYVENNPLTNVDPTGFFMAGADTYLVAKHAQATGGNIQQAVQEQRQIGNMVADKGIATLAATGATVATGGLVEVVGGGAVLGGYLAVGSSGAAGGYIGNGTQNVLEGKSFNENAGVATIGGAGLGVAAKGLSDGVRAIASKVASAEAGASAPAIERLAAEAPKPGPTSKVSTQTAPTSEVRGGPYGHLQDPPNANSGKPFTQNQKQKILAENESANKGVLRDDRTGEVLVRPQQSQKGVTPPANEAQVDHVYPRSKGGPNTYSNAEVRSRANNNKKRDRLED